MGGAANSNAGTWRGRKRGRRSKLRWALGLGLLAMMLLLGRGYGLLPLAGSAAVEPVPPPESAPRAASETRGAGDPDASLAARNGAEDAARTADDDRVHSVLSVVRVATGGSSFAAGYSALESLRSVTLSPEQAIAVAGERTRLEQALSQTVAELAAAVRAGRVLAAHRQLRLLLIGAHPAVLTAIGAAAHVSNWPDPARVDANAGIAPKPKALAKDRVVRMERNGSKVQGRVVEASEADVTLRLVDGQGVTFPSVAVTAVEPVEATAEDAAEMALAALAAGEPRLARLWTACGLCRGTPAPGSRLAAVCELLH